MAYFCMVCDCYMPCTGGCSLRDVFLNDSSVNYNSTKLYASNIWRTKNATCSGKFCYIGILFYVSVATLLAYIMMYRGIVYVRWCVLLYEFFYVWLYIAALFSLYLCCLYMYSVFI